MKIAYPKGAEWRKWDIHFHTPSSYDYKDKSVTNDGGGGNRMIIVAGTIQCQLGTAPTTGCDPSNSTDEPDSTLPSYVPK